MHSSKGLLAPNNQPTHPPTHLPGGQPAFMQGPNNNQNKDIWANVGRFLTGAGAKAALATGVASMAVGVSIGLSVAPPGTFQLYHTGMDMMMLLLRGDE